MCSESFIVLLGLGDGGVGMSGGSDWLRFFVFMMMVRPPGFTLCGSSVALYVY